MKKLLLLALAVTFTFGLSSCVTSDPECTGEQVLVDGVCEDPTPVADTTAPVLSGVVDVTIFMDATFDPLAGVSAIDAVDGDITTSIVIAGTVDTSEEGVTYLLYTVEDAAGNTSQASRNVTVEVDPSTIGDELIPNGNFDLGTALWAFDGGGVEGGIGTYAVTDGVMAITITTAGWGGWEPRMRNEGLTFENGVTYEISFKAKADAARSIKVDAAELLTAAPWTTQFAPTEVFDLTTEWETYSFKVTMTKDSNTNGSLLFQHGAFEGAGEDDNLNTVVYYDDIMMVVSTPDPDYTDPVFTGVDDVTVEVDTEFDPLEGVAVTDNLDGDMTITEDNVYGSVDITTEGTYTLTYVIQDASGNVAMEERVVTVVGLVFNDAGLLVNGDFEAALLDPAEWYIYEANWDGGPNPDGTVAIVAGEMTLEVVDIGTWGASDANGWILQLMQEVEYEVGQTYKVTFDGKAAAARAIKFVAGFVDSSDDLHGITKAVDLTTEYQTFEVIFTVTEDNMEYQDLLKFEFGQAVDMVTLDNVKLEVLSQPETVMNNDFSDVVGWGTWSKTELWWPEDPNTDLVNLTIDDSNGEYKISYDSKGNTAYYAQFFQEGYELVNGTTYRVTFDAYADVARSINGVMIIPNPANADNALAEYRETIAITDVKATYTFEFTATLDDLNSKLDFELGNVLGTETPGWVTFDNIMVEELDDSDVVVAGTNQTINGTFEEIPYWGTWSEAGGSSLAIVDGELEITTGALGAEFWGVQVYQENVSLIPGATYTVMFDASASVARDMNFTLLTGADIREVFSLTTDMQTFSLTFVYEGTAETGKLDFELGNISVSSLEAVVYLDNVLLFRDFTSVVPSE